MTTATEQLIEKIRKLRAKSEDPSTTQAESEAFAAKVADLLAQHQLTMADIADDTPEFVEEVFDDGYANPWRRSVFFAAARLYGSCPVNTTQWYTDRRGRQRDRLAFLAVGRPHTVAVTLEMTDYLFRTVVRLAQAHARENPDPYQSRRSVQLAFERGCGEALARRLNDLRWRQESVSGCRDPHALAIRSEQKQAEDYAFEHVIDGKIQSGANRGGSAAGAAAAEGISLAPQIRTGSGPRLLS
jgi:hypothetical protein